ncbi:MAG: hypothetical protein QXO98_04890 [Sulfolobales archaeon]
MSEMSSHDLRIYTNNEVMRVVGFIPEGHTHIRLVIELKDQTIVIQEATVAAIVRAYIDILTHPLRRAVELINARFGGDVKKKGYAEYQLIESSKSEDEVLREWSERLNIARK